MVAKDGWGEVVVNGEVGIGDNENGEEGVVWEIRSKRCGRDKEGGELGELRHDGEEGGEVEV